MLWYEKANLSDTHVQNFNMKGLISQFLVFFKSKGVFCLLSNYKFEQLVGNRKISFLLSPHKTHHSFSFHFLFFYISFFPLIPQNLIKISLNKFSCTSYKISAQKAQKIVSAFDLKTFVTSLSQYNQVCWT